jgi:PhnB protein
VWYFDTFSFGLPNPREGATMSELNAYLIFDGTCAQAMRFYERTLGGTLEMMTLGQSPIAAQTPPGSADRILRARLVMGDRMLMASDSMAGRPYEGMKGFSLSLIYATVVETQPVFNAWADGGQVTMALQKTFWAEAFGTPWMVNGSTAGV